jgi:hypothetical protein
VMAVMATFCDLGIMAPVSRPKRVNFLLGHEVFIQRFCFRSIRDIYNISLVYIVIRGYKTVVIDRLGQITQ